MAVDPVCSMEVDETNSPGHTEYDGVEYFFCSKACEQKFEHDPGQFTKQDAA